MSYKTYEEYKDSNIDWIKKIPIHWMPYKLKHVINEFVAGGTPESSNDSYWDENNDGIPWVAIGDMNDNDYINSTAKSITIEGLASKNLRILKKGTLIYSIFASLGKTSILNIDATTNQAILGLILSNKIDTIYLKFYLEALKSTISGFSNENTQENLNSNIVKNMEIAMPKSLEEQKQIANYLDKKTAKIDETICKNKQLIKLLEEKRTALINQVVTKGLNPNVPMKDSSVEWIGEVPEHYLIMKISNMFNNIGSGTTPKSSNEEYYTDGTVNWLITGDLNDNYIYETSTQITTKALHDTSSLKIYPQDSLVIAMYGATIGKLGILKIKTCTNQACCVLSKGNNQNIKYTYYWFLGYRNEIISLSYGGGQPNISQDVIKNLRIIVPPLNEQNQIVNYLDIETTKINKSISKIRENINLLEEYKTSLINHVVTGKINVRGEEI